LGQPAAAIEAYRQSGAIFAGLGQLALAAARLADVGQVQLATGEPEAALRTLAEAVAAAEASGDAACLFHVLEQLAHAQAVTGQGRTAVRPYEAALATALRACALAESADDPTLRAEAAGAHVLAGQMCQPLARWDEAVAHYERAATLAEQVGDRYTAATCAEGLAEVYGRGGRYEAAQAALERALAFYAAEPKLVASAVRVRGEMGRLAWDWGRPEQALAHYTAALCLAEESKQPAWAGAIARDIGNLYAYALGLPQEAQTYYRRAAASYMASADLEGRIEGQRQAGDLALAAGDADTAVQHYAAARRHAQRGGDRLAVAQCESALAAAHAARGDQQAALRHGRAAVRLYRRLGLPPQLGQAEMDLGGLLAQFGQMTSASCAYRRAVRTYLAADDRGGAALALVSLALTCFGQARYAAAGRALRQALKLAQTESLENFNTVHTAHLGLGAIAERTGHPRAALRHYRAALALAERYRAAMLHPQFRLAFLAGRQNLYGRAAVLAARQGQATAALDHVEASRSRTFMDLLALTALPRPAVRVASALLAEEARWLARLRGLLTQKPGDVPDYWRQVQVAWEHLEQLWADLGDPEYAALRQGRPASFADVRACLAPKAPRTAASAGAS
jgi:tetratricopeptide (TPR) repeat protein